MYSFISTLLEDKGLGSLAPVVAYMASIAIALVAAIFVRQISRKLLVNFFSRQKREWSEAFVKNKFFTWVSNLVLPIFLSFAVADIDRHSVFWSRVIAVLLVIIVIFLVDSLIRGIGDIYSSYEVSKAVPLRGVLQVLEIVVFVIGGIILVSIFVDRSPAALLGGLGAMTAIVTIVFKDAILGFVAGIQLSANDLVRVGDIIEMTQRDIFGTVQDISLVTVKVEAHDKTTIAIPTYTFVSEPFINRRSMAVAGARRIMRSFNIDASTVCVYKSEPDKRQATNLTIFREHLTQYLKTREDIRQDMTILVRQLTAAEHGIPLEIVVFVAEVDLVPYENIQSNIFDYIYGVLPEFGLQLYQRPSAYIKEGEKPCCE